MPLRTGTTTLISGGSSFPVLPPHRCPPRPLLAYRDGGSVKERPNRSHGAGAPTRPVPSSVSAVVLTHRRPRLATAVVRSLIEREGFPARSGGGGGQRDRGARGPPCWSPACDWSDCRATSGRPVDSVPGWRRRSPTRPFTGRTCARTTWGSSPSPARGWPMSSAGPRVVAGCPESPIGAVVAYGRRFVGRGAHTVNLVPPAGDPCELVPVDVASWGATLLARPVFDAGILPDPEWFFGLEDFDFFCRVRAGGFEVLVDGVSARAVADQQTSAGRAGALGPDRPTDEREPWRSYYHARNSIMLARRHGVRRGTCGTLPTRPGICKRPQGTPSARPFCTASGMASGVARGEPGLRPHRGGARRRGRGSRFSTDLMWIRIGRVGEEGPDSLRAPRWRERISGPSSSPSSRKPVAAAPLAQPKAGLTRHVRDSRHPRPDRVDERRPAGSPGRRPWRRPWSTAGQTTVGSGSMPRQGWHSATGVLR